MLEVGKLLELRYQLSEVEGRWAEVVSSQSMSGESRPTRDHGLVQLVVDEAGLQTVKQDRSLAWREERGMGEVHLGCPCLIVCLESDASLPQIRPASNDHRC